MDEPVRVVLHQPDWNRKFEALRTRLVSAIGDLVIRIEHVGSTAVPGLAAKPIIDLDLVIESSAQFPEVRNRLAQLGYVHIGDLGIAGREAFNHATDGDMTRHNLYVCSENAAELARHLRFRDRLIDDPELAAEYERLKIGLAERFRDDREGYTEGKTEFIERALSGET